MRLLTLLALLLTATITYAQDNITLRNGEEIPAKVLEVNQSDLKYRKSGNLEGPTYTAPLRNVLFIKYANGTEDTFGTGRLPLLGNPNSPENTAPAMRATGGLDGLQYHRSLFSRYYAGANGQRIRMQEAKSLLSTQPDALNALNRGRSLRCWSMATAIPAVLMIGAGVGLMAFEGNMGDGRGRDGMRNEKTGNTTADDNDNDDDNEGNDDHDGAIVGAAVVGGGVLLGIASVWLDHRGTMQFRRAANRYNSRAATTLRFVPSQRGVGLGAVLTF